MADNVNITQGVGTAVATDEIAGAHYQKMKLVDGAEGGTVGAVVDTDGHLHADVESLPQLDIATLPDVDVASLPSDVAAASGAAYGKGLLLQADGGAARANLKAEDSTNPNLRVAIYGGVYRAAVLGQDADGKAASTKGLQTGAHLCGFNGTTWDRLRGDITNGLDVDVTRLPAITGTVTANLGATDNTVLDDISYQLAAGNLSAVAGAVKAEDAVHSSGDSGVMALTVRKNTAAALAGADGDYAPLETDANGRMYTNTYVSADDTGKYTTPTHTTKSCAPLSSIALAANASRKYALFVNDSDTVIYLTLGASGGLHQGIRLNAEGGSYEMSAKLGNLYLGDVYAACSASPKTLLMTEGV